MRCDDDNEFGEQRSEFREREKAWDIHKGKQRGDGKQGTEVISERPWENRIKKSFATTELKERGKQLDKIANYKKVRTEIQYEL